MQAASTTLPPDPAAEVISGGTAVGIYDAKTRFSELIERVNATGERITITNRGKPVAELIPSRGAERSRPTPEELMAEVRELWKVLPPVAPGETRSWVEEGRERWPDR